MPKSKSSKKKLHKNSLKHKNNEMFNRKDGHPIKEEVVNELLEEIESEVLNEEEIVEADSDEATEKFISIAKASGAEIKDEEEEVIPLDISPVVDEELNNEEETEEEKTKKQFSFAPIINKFKSINGPKFGSFKLVFDATNIDDMLYLKVICFDIDFTGFKVKSAQCIYEKSFNLLSKTYEADLYLYVSELKEVLKKNEINKSYNVLNLCSNQMFFESITIPKLSMIESQRAVNLSLVKTYPEVKHKYVYDLLKVNTTQHNATYDVALLDINNYRKILDVVLKLKIGLNHVSLSFDSIRKSLIKESLLSRREHAIILNMKEHHTEVLSYDGKRVEGLRIAKEGYSKLISSISSFTEKDSLEIIEEINKGSILKDLINKRDKNTLVRKEMKEVILELRRILGNVLLEHSVDEIYLNIEGLESTLLADMLSGFLKHEVKEFNKEKANITQYLSCYGALNKPKSAVDYDYPTRVKIN